MGLQVTIPKTVDKTKQDVGKVYYGMEDRLLLYTVCGAGMMSRASAYAAPGGQHVARATWLVRQGIISSAHYCGAGVTKK
jgi:hypothetical protein